MNPFRDYSTDYLAYLFLMDKAHYSHDSYTQIKTELASRDFNFKNLNQEMYIRLVIKDFFEGWEKQVRKMFAELIANGWTFEQSLDYKYSWGRLTFRGFHTEVDPKFHQILEKYIKIFESTCGICGSTKKVENPDDQYFCKKCYLKSLKKQRITNIDKNGFSYFDKKKHHVVWAEIKNIVWETNDYESFFIKLKKNSSKHEIAENYDEQDDIWFSNRDFNFFQLLKKIPLKLLSESQFENIKKTLNSFEQCLVCGRKSLINDRCQICGNSKSTFEHLTVNSLRRFGSRKGMIDHKKRSFYRTLEDNTLIRYQFYTDVSFK